LCFPASENRYYLAKQITSFVMLFFINALIRKITVFQTKTSSSAPARANEEE